MSAAVGYDRLEHLRQVLFWEPKTLLMITVVKPYAMHADDSGKKNTSMVVVGGYLAEAAQWQALQEAWFRKTKKRGLKEFKRSAYDLKKLGHEFLLTLADLIQEYAVCGFACGVDCDDWRKVAQKYAMELFYLVPFSLSARTCISIVRRWCRSNHVPQEYMAYIFDKGSEDSGMLLELLKNDSNPEVRDVTIIPDDSKRIAGLQCADFLSWETRNQYIANSNPASWEELTPELARLLKGRFLSLASAGEIPKFGVYREADIEAVCRDAHIPLIADVPAKLWDRPKPIRLKLPTRLKP